jgi:uncharacterized protein DUF4231/conflict system pore-forming effector with SLATT domain
MAKSSRPKLFFVARMPKWRGIPEQWEKPENDDAYQERIKKSDFIVQEDLEQFGLNQSKTIIADLQDLHEYVLERYFRSDQKAKHYQNDYLRQQWILIIGTFITALVTTLTFAITPSTASLPSTSSGASATAAVAPGSPADTDVPSGAITSIPTSSTAKSVGIVTAIVTFITTIVGFMSQSHRPQYNWHLWRTVTEDLRRHYFLYLAHLPPYDTSEAHEILEANAVQLETQGEPSPPAADTVQPRERHSDTDIPTLIRLYRVKRVEVQQKFYEARQQEYTRNANFVAFTSVILVALATLLSTINVVIGWPLIVLIIALLPVLATLLATFEKVYGWSRQISLYEDAFKRLSRDNTIPPAVGHTPSRPYLDILLDFVSSVETTLKSETSQWGQNVVKDDSNTTNLSAAETLEMALAKSNLNTQQLDEIRRIFNQVP